MRLTDRTSDPERLKKVLRGAGVMTEEETIMTEIDAWKQSKTFREIQTAENYYRGQQDILNHERKDIGEGGRVVTVDNRPNQHLVDNLYAKAVDQKTNYLLSRPVTVTADGPLGKTLANTFNRQFQAVLKSVGRDAVSTGTGWLYVYWDDGLKFQALKPERIIADKDDEGNIVRVIYFYDKQPEQASPWTQWTDPTQAYGLTPARQHVEVYDADGYHIFDRDGETLTLKDEGSYLTVNGQGYNWTTLPVIPFRSNEGGQSLISRVKVLQDAINLMESSYFHIMQEDNRSTIFLLYGYGGENLDVFRENLAKYGAVSLSPKSSGGELDAVEIKVNKDNYESILKILKNAFISNARTIDSKDDRLTTGSPNQMNIRSMYADVDLDADEMETCFAASLDQLIQTFIPGSESEPYHITFTRNQNLNEEETIQNLRNSVDMLSLRTILEHHPYVNDVDEELKRLQEQKQAENEVPGMFGDTDTAHNTAHTGNDTAGRGDGHGQED